MSDSGSGKRGFVRDVMKRISAQGTREPDDRGDERPPREDVEDLESLRDALRFLAPDSGDIARRVDRLITDHELLKQRFERARQQGFEAERQNEKLVNTLQDAKQQ